LCVGRFDTLTIILCTVLTAQTARADASLTGAAERWAHLGDDARTGLVQALTLAGPRSAAKRVVRRCLGEADGDLLATCVSAAARLQMVSSAPLVRQTIRRSTDPAVLAVAARTLGRWKDTHSQDLLLWALATERGAEATHHVLQGWLKLNPKHEGRYLRFLWETATPGTPRYTEFATRLLSRTHGNNALAGRVRDHLLEVWERWRADRAVVDDDVALRVAWGLFADPRGCRIMFARAGLKQGEGRKDPLIRRFHRSRCRPFRDRSLPATTDNRLPLPALPDRSGRLATTPTEARWAKVLASLQVTDARIARQLAATQRRLRAADDWSRVRTWNRLRRPATFKPKGVRDLERMYAGLAMPSMEQPPHGLQQPDWWPDSILLTVDDGPRPQMLGPLLDVLADRGVKAVFFFVASQLTKSLFGQPAATRSVLARVKQEGHTIGFHSMNHAIRLGKHLMWRERDQIADSVRAFRSIIQQTTGHPWPVTLARLPGAQGRLHAWVNRGLMDGGTGPHMHWEGGGHGWTQRTTPKQLRRLAGESCRRHAKGLPTRLLLHESPQSARQVAVFVDAVKKRCAQPQREANRAARR